jgi:hypothetical protein
MAGTDVIHLFAVGATATNSAPSGAPASAGFGAGSTGRAIPARRRGTTQWNLWVRINGTDALTFQGRLWINSAGLSTFAAPTVDLNVWGPAGKSATMDNRGLLNDGNTLSGTNLIAHTEPFEFTGSIDGAHLQITTLTGTGATVHAWLVSNASGA